MANEVRLIDANMLKANFPVIGKCVDDLYPSGVVRRAIDNAPTVDAAPVVHAHWEDGCAIHNGKEVYKSIDCSHCNEIFKTEDREYWKKRFKVCPFCGAIMDGVDDDV